MSDETLDPKTNLQKFTAEQTANCKAAKHGWAIVVDPTPGGRDNGDGTRFFSLRFPALLLSEWVGDPEGAAHEVAAALNENAALRARATIAETLRDDATRERNDMRARAEAAEAERDRLRRALEDVWKLAAMSGPGGRSDAEARGWIEVHARAALKAEAGHE